MRESQKSSFDSSDHHRHCSYNQEHFKNKIRYYTPQPMNYSYDNHKIDTVNRSFLDCRVTDNNKQTNRDSGYSSDQQKEAKTVTCFKGSFEPKKIIQGALRTQSLLRRCYTPNHGVEYRVEISPLEESRANKRLPEQNGSHLAKVSTTDRNTLDNHNILRHFSNLSKEAFQNGSLFGLKKPIKQRPKLDALFDLKSDLNQEPFHTAALSPVLVSKAETECKNFLYDMYLKKAEDSLDEFENKKEIMNISDCLRLLDRCIEFYELALKTLAGNKEMENTKILLRTKQSKVILKKRHLWKNKSVLTQLPSPSETGSVNDNYCNKNGRHNYQEMESNPTFRCKEGSVLNHERLYHWRPCSATSYRPTSISSIGDKANRNSKSSLMRDSTHMYTDSGNGCINNCTNDSAIDKVRYNRSISLHDACQPPKIKISLKKDHSADLRKRMSICTSFSSSSQNSITHPPITKMKPLIPDGVTKSRRMLPKIPETKNQSSIIDITSRIDRCDQPFVKISLV